MLVKDLNLKIKKNTDLSTAIPRTCLITPYWPSNKPHLVHTSNSLLIFRPFVSDGMETGSLLVPMVLASQIAFIERWPDKNLKVSGTIKLYNTILKQCTYYSLT